MKTQLLKALITSGNTAEMFSRANELKAMATEFLEELVLSTDKTPHSEEASKIAKTADKEASILLAALSIQSSFVTQSPRHDCETKTTSDFKSQKLKIPTFNGNLKTWRSWWEQFKLSIHDTPKTDTEKYLHLKNALTGAAKIASDGYAVTAENYPKVIKLLEERFGDPRKLQDVYFSELDAIRTASSADENRQNHDAIRKILTNLASINTDTDQDILKKMVLQKYSSKILENTLRVLHKDFSLEEFLEAATSEIVTQEYIEQIYSFQYKSDKNENITSPSNSTPRPSTSTTACLIGGASNSYKEKAMTCVFCRNQHSSISCRRYPTTSSRRDRAATLKLCFLCLRGGHAAKGCDKRSSKCSLCKESGHPPALCSSRVDKTKTPIGTFLLSFYCFACNSKGNRSEPVRGFVDQGSTVSYIKKSLAEKLDLDMSKKSSLFVYRFNSVEKESIKSSEVLVTLKNFRQQGRTVVMKVSDHITGSFQSTPDIEIVNQVLPRNLKYADFNIFNNDVTPFEILIGNDFYHSMIDIFRSKILPNGLVLYNSFFGWIPSGSIQELSLNHDFGSLSNYETATLLAQASNLTTEMSRTPVLVNKETPSLEFLWSLEVLGIKPDELVTTDELIYNQFRETVIFENNRYTVRWPWKSEHPSLDSNFRMSLARLRSLVEKSTPEVLNQCDESFRKQLSDGIIEEAPHGSPHLIHYLPHRPIFQKGKMRIVYDASARTKNGRSLNNLLHAGPVLTKDLVGLLLNFRIYPIGIVADIEKAFLQIGLNPIDRDSVRFLWLRDWTKPISKDNLKVFRFARVPFGVISSPFLLNMVLQETLTGDGSANIWHLRASESFYVDNLVISVQDTISASRFFNVLMPKMKEISFNLRDWLSNDKRFSDLIPPELRHPEDSISVLGLIWNSTSDTLSLKIDFQVLPTIPTKRIALQLYASIFDPLGLIAPATLFLKIFVRCCWKNKFEWDQTLPSYLEPRWLKIISELKEISAVSIPRRIWPMLMHGTISLHIFCDASKDAFACCAYLCISSVTTNQVETAIIFSKTRLAPIKEISIPKLELLAVWIGKRTANFLRSVLKVTISRIVLWTDATTVLQWLQSSAVQSTFVRNRLNEIRRAPNFEVRYVPTGANPADVATRGARASTLLENEVWWKGPHWLFDERLWPSPPANSEIFHTSGDSDPIGCLLFVVAKYKGFLTDRLETRFSSWNKYIRLFSLVLRYVFSTLKYTRLMNVTDGELFAITERFFLLALQEKYFLTELRQLRKGLQPDKNLEYFLDAHGLIRCKGRLHNARLPFDTIHPILLPRKSPLVRTLIHEMHQNNFHIGCNQMLTKLRERFWILKGRAFVKSVLHRCVTCKRWTGGAYKLPPIPPLPLVRVAEVAPFLHTGLDNLGPLNIDKGNGESEKCYVTLFTCLVTRAIHLELVKNQSAEEFLLALTRFTSRRGVPQVIISDNATNFVAVQPFVGTRVTLKDAPLHNFVSCNNIRWHFIPQYAPWYGGAYERLVGLVKNCLRKSLGFLFYDYVKLSTALCQIEDTVNSRPLTYVSDELVAPLTPNHFLRLRTINVTQVLEPSDEMLSSTPANLASSWRDITQVVEAFWSAFRSDYLLSLRERHSSIHKPKKGSVSFLPRKGEIVLVKEPSAPRCEWKYATVVKVDPRQAIAYIRYKGRTQLRTINQLYPLEVPQPSRPL